MNDLKFRPVMAVVTAALLLGACSSSGEAPQKDATPQSNASVQKAESTAAPAPTSGQPGAGLRIFIDPVTGKPRDPTAAEIKALEAADQVVSQKEAVTPKPGKEIVLPNGTVAIQNPSMSEMKACVQKSGQVVVEHDCKSDSSSVTKP